MPRIDYTSRDFDSIKESLESYLRAKFPNDWKNFYASGISTAILNLIAYVFDNLAFSTDYIANELFLDTAQDRSSVVKLGKMLGYKLRPPTTASVRCTLRLPESQGADVIIPAGTVVQTAKGLYFRFIADHTITTGDVADEAVLSEGNAFTETHSGTGVTWQRIQLENPDAAFGSVRVRVEGESWQEYDSLVQATDVAAFEVKYDEDGIAYVQFGDGNNGLVPPLGEDNIEIEYVVGSGVRGNVYLNELNRTVTGIMGSDEISVRVMNDQHRGVGGEDAETIEHAKLWIPYWVQANGRAVTENDFDVLASRFAGEYGAFAYAKARLKQEIPELNTVMIAVWYRNESGNIIEPEDETEFSDIKNALESYFMNNGDGAVRIICTDVETEDGKVVYFDGEIDVFVQSNFALQAVEAAVTEDIENLLTGSVTRPGRHVRISRIYRTIHETAGVEHAAIKNMNISSTRTFQEDGYDTSFYEFTLSVDNFLPIIPGTVRITVDGTEINVVDDTNGSFIGEAVGTIDYDTGEVSITFDAEISNERVIDVRYRTMFDYYREEKLGAVIGSSASGILSYPPIVPRYNGIKGVLFQCGGKIISDDGSGKLLQDSTEVGTINYTTGEYQLTFDDPPETGSMLYAVYYQKLSTPCRDIPIGKDQLLVPGRLQINSIRFE